MFRWLAASAAVVLLAATTTTQPAHAYSQGAGRCITTGEAAPLHGNTKVSGAIHDAFMALTVGRTEVFDGDQVEIPVGSPVDISISSADPYKGILFQIGQMPDVIVTDYDNSTLQLAFGMDCVGRAAVTHVNPAPKYRSQITIVLEEAMETTLDVNIVLDRNTFFHSQVTLNAVGGVASPPKQPATPGLGGGGGGDEQDAFLVEEEEETTPSPAAAVTTIVPDRTTSTKEPLEVTLIDGTKEPVMLLPDGSPMGGGGGGVGFGDDVTYVPDRTQTYEPAFVIGSPTDPPSMEEDDGVTTTVPNGAATKAPVDASLVDGTNSTSDEEQQPFDVPSLTNAPPAANVMMTIVDVLNSRNYLSLLANAVMAAGLDSIFNTTDSLTLFAPINNGFNIAPFVDRWLAEEQEEANDWTWHWRTLLTFHMVNGLVYTRDLLPGGALKSMMTPPQNILIMDGMLEAVGADIALMGDMMQQQGSNIIQGDIEAVMGLVHVVDYPIMPTWLTMTVNEYLVGESDQSTLVDLIVTAGLEDALQNEPVTFLTPDPFVLDEVITFYNFTDDEWSTILQIHMIPGVWYTSKMTDGMTLTSMGGADLQVTLQDDTVSVFPALKIQGASVKTPDVLANNGLIHVMAQVMIPQDMLPTNPPSSAPTEMPSSIPTSSPTPVPTSEPTKAPTSSPTVSDAPSPVPSDMPSPVPTPSPTSGPTSGPTEEPTPGPTSSPTPEPGVEEMLEADFDLSALASALETAGMVDILNGDGTFTIFAPTDSVFDALPSELQDILTQPDWIVHLRTLLANHVIDDRALTSSMIRNAMTVVTSNGEAIVASVDDDLGIISWSGDAFDDSTIVEADITAGNGVAHKVDQVFLPSTLSQNLFRAMAASTGEATAFLVFVTRTGMESAVSADSVTLFVPTNDAFEAMSTADQNLLLTDLAAAKSLVEQHMVSRVWATEKLTDGLEITSVAGGSLSVSVSDDDTPVYQVGDATILQGDLVAKNGLMHVIDTVLFSSLLVDEDSAKYIIEESTTPTLAPVASPVSDSDVANEAEEETTTTTLAPSTSPDSDVANLVVSPLSAPTAVPAKVLGSELKCSFDEIMQVALPGVPGGLMMKHFIDAEAGTISFQLMYGGQGWIGVGFSNNGQMVGSKAVIGLPDANTVGLYNLGGYAESAVVPSNDDISLTNASITQSDTTTILTFTRSIGENDGLTAQKGAPARLIYAVGATNQLSYHTARSSVGISFGSC